MQPPIGTEIAISASKMVVLVEENLRFSSNIEKPVEFNRVPVESGVGNLGAFVFLLSFSLAVIRGLPAPQSMIKMWKIKALKFLTRLII